MHTLKFLYKVCIMVCMYICNWSMTDVCTYRNSTADHRQPNTRTHHHTPLPPSLLYGGYGMWVRVDKSGDDRVDNLTSPD